MPALLLPVVVLIVSLHCNADGVEEDEALARRLQEQEDALATRGRATRGALRVPQKPSQAAQKGPSRDARQARGSASAGVRSSSRLKPEAAQGKQRPVTRGSTGNSSQHVLCLYTWRNHRHCQCFVHAHLSADLSKMRSRNR